MIGNFVVGIGFYVTLAHAVVFVLGLLLSAVELSTRYDKLTRRTVVTAPFLVYILLNGLFSFIALVLIRVFEVNLGLPPSSELIILQSLLAVVGTAVLLRSSIFVIEVSNEEVELGFSGFLRVLREAVDRVVDRKQAEERARLVESLMKDISFERAFQALPMYCLTLAGSALSPEEQASLGHEIAKLREVPLSDALKSRVLGLTLADSVGEDVLRASVKGIGAEIRRPVEKSSMDGAE